MTTLNHFPTLLSLYSHKQFSTVQKHHQRLNLYWNLQLYSAHERFSVCACSIKKPRVRRKVKSDAELCNEIKEFVAAVGLPEGHVPKTKELSQHGRSDLANIVRRRGYKLIRELLTNSAETEGSGLDTDRNVAETEDTNSVQEDELTGQDGEVNVIVEDGPSTEVVISRNLSGTPNFDIDNNVSQSSCGPMESSMSLVFEEDPSFNLAENSQEVEDTYGGHLSSQAYIMETNRLASSIDSDIRRRTEISSKILSHLEETSGNSYGHDNSISEADGRHFLSAEVLATESDTSDINTDPNVFSIDHSTSQESSIDFAMEEEGSYDIKMPDEEIKDNAESYSQSAEFSPQELYFSSPDIDSPHDISMTRKYSADSTLKQKVADFLQNGNLDTFEDNAYEILHESDAEESKLESGNVNEYKSSTSGQADPEDMLSGSDSTASAIINHINRDNQALGEGTNEGHTDVDSDAETMKRHNQAELNRLKFMLRQKELELSHLKEQIEKEKVALSALQTKAESEIGKAQKLISEKDAELSAAEESLSGLKEVEVEYSGNGEIVELAGSFNGWHHPVKMDPHLSSDVVEHIGSRKKRLWSTRLWLYPGMYEIKFIVDGHWVLDPQRESIARGAICNNILRVD